MAKLAIATSRIATSAHAGTRAARDPRAAVAGEHFAIAYSAGHGHAPPVPAP
jgi:hypothetical protein